MIGPSFSAELEAAGLIGLPFAWTQDGTILGRENLTPLEQSALDAVVLAHDPLKLGPQPEPPLGDSERKLIRKLIKQLQQQGAL